MVLGRYFFLSFVYSFTYSSHRPLQTFVLASSGAERSQAVSVLNCWMGGARSRQGLEGDGGVSRGHWTIFTPGTSWWCLSLCVQEARSIPTQLTVTYHSHLSRETSVPSSGSGPESPHRAGVWAPFQEPALHHSLCGTCLRSQ